MSSICEAVTCILHLSCNNMYLVHLVVTYKVYYFSNDNSILYSLAFRYRLFCKLTNPWQVHTSIQNTIPLSISHEPSCFMMFIQPSKVWFLIFFNMLVSNVIFLFLFQWSCFLLFIYLKKKWNELSTRTCNRNFSDLSDKARN